MYKVEMEWTDCNGVQQSETRAYATQAAAIKFMAKVCVRADVMLTMWKEEADA